MHSQGKGMSAAYIVLALLALMAFYVWRQSQRPPAPSTLTERDVADEMKLRAHEAVHSAANEFGIRLDFTPESVEQVESILAKIHERHAAAPLSDSDLIKESLKWGAYVGDVIRRVRSARWGVDSVVGGPGSFPIIYEDSGESFPIRWCHKRIVNGEEDNVWHKFTLLVIERDAGDERPQSPDPIEG
jgi:hypothetical protein